jgi:SAM-dependent methyltransferase
MNLTDLRDSWNALAEKDAFDAVLTRTRGTKDRWNVDAFFRTGHEEVEFILHRIRSLGSDVAVDRALDFGCGVGRVTQALCRHFQQVDGVDISHAMITRAQKLNRHGGRCRYHLNERDDLRIFGDNTFDFVYSVITLQHMEPQYGLRYLDEFFRVLRPHGITVFQVPDALLPTTRPSTRSSKLLPGPACRAVIESGRSLTCAPGSWLPLRVTVRNIGSQTWPAMSEHDGPYAIRLGNHWRRRFGRMLRFDDRRTALPHDVAPGESVVMGLPVNAPTEPGTYTLELDMVQEEVRWFARAGSRPTRIRVRVDSNLPPGEVRGLPAYMEMYGIPRPEVEAVILRHGVLLAVNEDDAPGPAWRSFRYIARKDHQTM